MQKATGNLSDLHLRWGGEALKAAHSERGQAGCGFDVCTVWSPEASRDVEDASYLLTPLCMAASPSWPRSSQRRPHPPPPPSPPPPPLSLSPVRPHHQDTAFISLSSPKSFLNHLEFLPSLLSSLFILAALSSSPPTLFYFHPLKMNQLPFFDGGLDETHSTHTHTHTKRLLCHDKPQANVLFHMHRWKSHK